MDFQLYYSEIKNKLKKYSDVVYYMPMSNNEIVEMEKIIGYTIKPLYREYLSAFGMTQDVFEMLRINMESFIADFNCIKNTLKGYLPISVNWGQENTILLINNNDLEDDFIHFVKVDENDNIGQVKKLKLFTTVIEDAILNLAKMHKYKCHNEDKINNIEFAILGNDFTSFIEVFKNEGLKQCSDWGTEYYPKDIYGVEIAIFELYNNEILIERDINCLQYSFEIEEPILIDVTKSIIYKIEQILKLKGIKYEKNESNLIENEY